MRSFLVWILGLTLVSCTSKMKSKTEDEKAIRALLEQERKAHYDRDAKLFTGEFSDSMISVNRGVVKRTPPDTMRKSVQKYFDAVLFRKWDDMAEPVIRFSEDRTLAYAIIQKEVIVSYPDNGGKEFFDTTRYAWATVYRKQAGRWMAEANISTNQ